MMWLCHERDVTPCIPTAYYAGAFSSQAKPEGGSIDGDSTKATPQAKETLNKDITVPIATRCNNKNAEIW